MSKVMKNSGIQWIGKIPCEWRVYQLKQIAKCLDSRRIPVDAAFRNHGPYPYWGAGSIVDYIDSYIFDEEIVLLGEDGAPFFDPYRPVSFYVNEKVWINNHIHVLKAYSHIVPQYLVYVLNSVDYGSFINGSILNKLTQTNMNSITIPMPLTEIQKAIFSYLDVKCSRIDNLIYLHVEIMTELKLYKQSVITEAVTKGLDPDVPMKDSGVEWIGYIPEDAKVVTVARLYRSCLGKMVCDNPSKDSDTLEPYLCAINVHFDGIDLSTLKEMWFSIDEKQKYILKNGDLLVVEGGAGSGGAAIVEIADTKNLYIQNSIHLVRANEGIALNKYLYYTLYSLVKRSYIDFVCNKATIPHFTKEKLMATPIVFFPMKIQEEIIDYLDTKCRNIDEMISLKQSKIDTLKEYKKSLIYECVTGKRDCTMGRQDDGA